MRNQISFIEGGGRNLVYLSGGARRHRHWRMCWRFWRSRRWRLDRCGSVDAVWRFCSWSGGYPRGWVRGPETLEVWILHVHRPRRWSTLATQDRKMSGMVAEGEQERHEPTWTCRTITDHGSGSSMRRAGSDLTKPGSGFDTRLPRASVLL